MGGKGNGFPALEVNRIPQAQQSDTETALPSAGRAVFFKKFAYEVRLAIFNSVESTLPIRVRLFHRNISDGWGMFFE